jgi:nicotinate phosphoribosyltransferase
MVELRRGGEVHFTAKFSDEKKTLPGAKQIYRFAEHDTVALSSECNTDFSGAEPLLRPVIHAGEIVEALPSLTRARSRAASAIAALPSRLRSLDTAEPYRVEVSPRLIELAEGIRSDLQPARP